MYKYSYEGCLAEPGSTKMHVILNLMTNESAAVQMKQLKPLLEKNEVINAVLSGSKIVPVQNVCYWFNWMFDNLADGNENYKKTGKVKVIAKVSRKAGNRVYLRFYDENGRMLTGIIYKALQRFSYYTKNDELSVSNEESDAIKGVLRLLNKEAKNCGIDPFFDLNYTDLNGGYEPVEPERVHHIYELGTSEEALKGLDISVVYKKFKNAVGYDFAYERKAVKGYGASYTFILTPKPRYVEGPNNMKIPIKVFPIRFAIHTDKQNKVTGVDCM